MTHDDEAVTREIDLDAGVAEVWRALVDDAERREWMGGDTALEVAPGGRGFVTDDDGTRRDVLVADVEPERSLTIDWWTETEAPSRVEFVLLPAVRGTRLVVTERPLVPSAQASAAARSLQWSLALRFLSLASV